MAFLVSFEIIIKLNKRFFILQGYMGMYITIFRFLFDNSNLTTVKV